jgi:four helix bundle protein
MSLSSFRDLGVWQEAMKLTAEVYRGTISFPRHELYGLSSQMRRAAVSVPSNIAEGKGHRSDKEFSHFLYHARGSLLELEDSAFDRGRITILISGRWAAIVGHM